MLQLDNVAGYFFNFSPSGSVLPGGVSIDPAQRASHSPWHSLALSCRPFGASPLRTIAAGGPARSVVSRPGR
ncbi:hypothetical protein WA026_013809 [Henosepilachna vigintioctopunctata]|uniref:Uncharacterized protein n=1 Tax=Henosepilachna vigintioctopunctata TaxID=420089 RepID=A0AAW1V1H9_9CUCU